MDLKAKDRMHSARPIATGEEERIRRLNTRAPAPQESAMGQTH